MKITDSEKRDIIKRASALFAFDCNEAAEIPGHEGGRNLVFRIGTESVLRISTLTDRTEADYLAEVEYVHFLAEGGASVADSIPSESGNRVELIDGMAVSMFETAKGDQIADHGYRYREGVPIDKLMPERYFYRGHKQK